MSVTLPPIFFAAALTALARLQVSWIPLMPCSVNLIVLTNVAIAWFSFVQRVPDVRLNVHTGLAAGNQSLEGRLPAPRRTLAPRASEKATSTQGRKQRKQNPSPFAPHCLLFRLQRPKTNGSAGLPAAGLGRQQQAGWRFQV